MDSQPDSRHTDCHTLKLIKYFVILHFINACTIAHSITSTTIVVQYKLEINV